MPNRQALNLNFDIKAQPDELTCGPTCLHALYQYYNDEIGLQEVISEVKSLKSGGTLAVMLGNHALQRGYKAHIHTYNLNAFDPSWFKFSTPKMIKLLKQQMKFKVKKKKLIFASKAYIKFLESGGKVYQKELSAELIKGYLRQNKPILTGLSATYLYGTPREIPSNGKYDSIKGEPMGHFVIITGFDEATETVYLADPLHTNPLKSHYYSVNFDRLINSILLGIVTYDANLLIIEQKK
jgi:hypothetical protein